MNIAINVPDHVENHRAYIAGAEARIRNNKFRSTLKRWLAMPGAQRLEDLFFDQGEFERQEVGEADEFGERRRVYHPLKLALYSHDFLRKMYDTRCEWGGLTEKQHAAALSALARLEERVNERTQKAADARAKDLAQSAHVGAVGERRVFSLTIRNALSFETAFGLLHVTICEDETGNVIVYKGSKRLGERGAAISIKATVKAHDVREGVAQTLIARPA